MAYGLRRGGGRPAAWRRIWPGPIAVLVVLSQLASGAAPAQAAARRPAPPVPKTKSIPVSAVASHYRRAKPMPTWRPQRPQWPAGTALAAIPAGASSNPPADGTGGLAQAGQLPVWVGPATGTSARGAATATPPQVKVSIAPSAMTQRAGVKGLIIELAQAGSSASPARMRLRISYAGFADAYGADWGSRLALVTPPACALTTPRVAACRAGTPLRFSNDSKHQVLEAVVTLPGSASGGQTARPLAPAASGTAPLLVAVASVTQSDAGSGGGDFTATSLKPSGSWQAGGSSDAFTWTYPVTAPNVPGGLVPQVQLAYNSQSVDGLTSSTNNQASVVGDGWQMPESYIERSYQSCHQNPAGSTQTWDNCWSSNNQLAMSLNGQTSMLVKDDTTGKYHPADDSSELVQYKTGAPNGAYNGEYWVVTTTDGTQYWFGYNELPGWAAGNATTNSADTEPVYSTASGQPCYNSSFASSYCAKMAYRWNLDYVVDTHQDVISYWYQTDTNYYAQDKGTTAPSTSAYTRDSYLAKIQYGQRAGQVYSTTPAGEITFTVNGRCDTSATGCATSTLTSSTASDWPDVPYDMNCASGASCQT